MADLLALSSLSSSSIIVYAVKQMQMSPSILFLSLWKMGQTSKSILFMRNACSMRHRSEYLAITSSFERLLFVT